MWNVFGATLIGSISFVSCCIHCKYSIYVQLFIISVNRNVRCKSVECNENEKSNLLHFRWLYGPHSHSVTFLSFSLQLKLFSKGEMKWMKKRKTIVLIWWTYSAICRYKNNNKNAYIYMYKQLKQSDWINYIISVFLSLTSCVYMCLSVYFGSAL